MANGVEFTREELALLHEMLSYTQKRTFTGGEKTRLGDLIGRVEERLLEPGPEVRPFPVTAPEAEAFALACETYSEALEAPFSAEVSRKKAAKLKELVGRFSGGSGFMSALRKLFGR